jgi:hypothetical protein
MRRSSTSTDNDASMEDAPADATWDELYRRWAEVRLQAGEEAPRRLRTARKRLARNTPDDWRWLAEALADAERKWFVAGIFKIHSVPRRLLGPMLQAGVRETNPSANRWLIEPCVESHGARQVLEMLLRYLETGSDSEKAGAASALYWVRNPRSEDVGGPWERARDGMLREFVANPDLEVRRRIIPMLNLDPDAYPESLRPLVPAAVEIARAHPDTYIRHRVEVQLGAAGPLMPLPPSGSSSPGDAPPSHRSESTMHTANATASKKLKTHRLLSLLMIIIGLVLMVFMIRTESEPGALPLLLVVLGIAWHVITWRRMRSHRA